MARISLTIDKNYCANWGLFEGIREFLQNSKDADDDGFTMSVTHYPRTDRLEIVNQNVYVEPSKLLILGKSDKKPGEKRGQFGEGFVLGCIALVRQGHEVSFENGDFSWGISFEQPDDDHPLAGNELLTFKSRKVSAGRQDFKIEVTGITAGIWAELRKLFLFIDKPSQASTLVVEQGRVLLDPSRKGQVFSRGIFVRSFEDLSCGYDLKNLELDRDRRFVDEWSLHWQLSQMWQQACSQYPEQARDAVYKMIERNAPETKNIKYNGDERLFNRIKERFFEEHGENAVPISSAADAKDVEDLGGKPLVVSEALREVLAKTGVTAEAKRAQLEEKTISAHEIDTLSAEHQEVVKKLRKICDVQVVTFRSDKTLCRLINDKANVGLSVKALDVSFPTLLKTVLSLEAKRRNVEALDVAVEKLVEYYPSANEKEAPEH